MLVRCTQRLLKASRLVPDPDPPVPSSPMGEWYATALPLRFPGRWLVLYVHATTLVAVLVPGRTLNGTLEGFRIRMPALLYRFGMPEAWIARETAGLTTVVVGKTASRQILGFMNDMQQTIAFQEDEARSFAELHLDRLEDEIAMTPYSAGSRHARWPRNDLRALAGLQPILRR